MRHLLIGKALLLVAFLVFTYAKTYYVTPMASTPCPEEGVPCFTLSQYATRSNDYFAANATFLFLTGNHSLELKFWIENTVTVSIIAGNTTTYYDTSITCSKSGRFILSNISIVSIRGLALIGCVNNNLTSVEQFTLEDCSLQGQGHNGTGLELIGITNANIVRSSFSLYTGKEIWDPFYLVFIGASGAIIIRSSRVTISSSAFNNIVSGENDWTFGGAIYAASSSITFYTTAFTNNIVTGYRGIGGAVYVRSSNVTMHNTTFNNNTATGVGGALYVDLSSSIFIFNSIFNNNTVTSTEHDASGGAVSALSSNITIHTTIFNNNTVTAHTKQGDNLHGGQGGAVYAWLSNITVETSTFNSNTVTGVDPSGGAIYAFLSNIAIHTTTFNKNSVTGYDASGGAMCAWSSNINILITTFNNNIVNGDGASGGAVCTVSSDIITHTITFNNNSVTGYDGRGGAMYFDTVTLDSVNFLIIKNNMADVGSALYAIQSTMNFSGNTTISKNYGSLYAYSCNLTFFGHTNIMNNLYSTNTSQEGGAVTAIQTEIVFTGTANLSYNTADMHGGGISATQSKLFVYGDVTITHNTALISGGGIYAYQSELNLENYFDLSNNSAVERGGGIHVVSSITRMTDLSKTYLVGNYAKRGGGACLEMNAKLYIVKKEVEYVNPDKWIRLEFTENSADYGGALYITDDTNSGTCHGTPFSIKSTFSSECFLQGLALKQSNEYSSRGLNIRNTFFTNNSASVLGDAIYGGLLDRCTVNPYAEIFLLIQKDNIHPVFNASSLNAVSYLVHKTNLGFKDSKAISSDPVRVCFCRDNQPDCSYYPQPLKVKKGETFTLLLVAADQINNTISNSKIFSYLSAKAGLGEEESIQTTGEGCTKLHYTVTSRQKSEQLHLYADGPCKDIGISLQTVNITFTACPTGFKDTGSKCDCDPELTQYIFNCSIAIKSVLRKGNVWIAFMNASANKSVVTYLNCPFDYCYPSTQQIWINVEIPDDADKQCAFNRSGKLCGSCRNGLSVSLGSSRCIPCSNNWLALLSVFTIAGVALVAFLLICNFTVAAGTVNGLLFYANIISSNKATFFPNSINIFFSIFTAWLNLDFGFETCFFNGLNGYWKTWLQLAFPAYVIILVIVVIKVCDYSHRFARLIARKNPVATLDTLVLLSYTKFIRTIISAWQFATLEYDNGTHELVWLVDANIKYFELKHIPLFIAALVILIIALIYTLLLFLWQWLLLCPNRKPVRWIRNSRLHGIMDAYFITFNKNHRYWTGLLLLARVFLYLVSAFNGVSTTDPGMNLLAISCVIGCLILWKEIIKGKIYRKWLLNILDSLFLFNLLILTVATFYVREAGGNQTTVASTSVSIAFITFILILSYHAYTFVLLNQVDSIKARIFKSINGTISKEMQNGPKNHNEDVTVSVTVVDQPEIPVNYFDSDEEEDSAKDNNCPTMTGQKETQSQYELKNFTSGSLESKIGIITGNSHESLNYPQEEKDEESDVVDYDEFAPLLPLYNTA